MSQINSFKVDKGLVICFIITILFLVYVEIEAFQKLSLEAGILLNIVMFGSVGMSVLVSLGINPFAKRRLKK